MEPRKPTISQSERDVLKVLWDHGAGTVRDIAGRLRETGREWAYTTVMTLLGRLEAKGYVTSDKSGFAHVFHAAVSRDGVVQQRLEALAEEFCDGEPAPLVLALVQGQRFTPEELAEFRRLIDELEPEEAQGKEEEIAARVIRGQVMVAHHGVLPMVIWWLIETTLTVAVLAAVVTAACHVLRCSPAVRHALWLVVLLKLLLPPLVPCPWSPIQYLDEALTPAATAEAQATPLDNDMLGTESPVAPTPAASDSWPPDAHGRQERPEPRAHAEPTVSSEATGPGRPTTASASAATAQRPATSRHSATSHTPIAAWWMAAKSTWRRTLHDGHVAWAVLTLWIAAGLAVAWRQSWAMWRLSRMSHGGQSVPPWLEGQVAAVAAMLRVQPPELVVAPGIRTPFVWCLTRPQLYWPSALVEPLDTRPSPNRNRSPAADRWQGVIAHELAHLGRRDHWVAWVELLTGWLWWWNPVFRYVRSQLRESAELACDAWVVASLPRSRRAYAEALVEVSELVSAAAPLVPVLGASTGAGRAFQRRLTMILRDRVPCNVSWQGLLGVVLLAVLALPSWLIAQSPAAKQVKPTEAGKPAAGPAPEALAASPVELSGDVQAVDAGRNTIHLGGKQVNETFPAKSVRVILDDGTGDRFGFREGALGDVVAGQSVTIRLSPDRKEVVGIWAEGPIVRGILKSVDPAKRSITLAVVLGKGEGGQEKTFPVAETAKVTVLAEKSLGDKNWKGWKDGKGFDKGALHAAQLADLPVGAVVTAKLSADQRTAGRIQAEMPSVQGILKAIDAAKNTLTLRIALTKGEPASDHTYELAKDVKVSLDGLGGKLSDLPLGVPLTLRLSVGQKVVLGIEAEGPSVQGVLKVFDAAKGTLTLRMTTKGEPEVERTYNLAKDAKATIDGEGRKVADVPVDAPLRVRLSANQKVVLSIQVEGTTAMGVLKVVDADSRSITIAGKQGDWTLAVAKDAAISVDDKPATLADVPVEALVTAKLSADQKTARGLSAQGRHVQGVAKAVDTVNREITIDIAKQGEEKFKLAEDVQVLLHSADKTAVRAGKLADVKAESRVGALLSADQKTVRRLTVVEE